MLVFPYKLLIGLHFLCLDLLCYVTPLDLLCYVTPLDLLCIRAHDPTHMFTTYTCRLEVVCASAYVSTYVLYVVFSVHI